MPLGQTIDNYLAGRGSPMAGTGADFVQAGKKFGVDPRLLVGIATIESGAGAHLANPFNPFNWGVHRGQQYDNWSSAITDVARGLRQNYLDHGLDTPSLIVRKYAPGSDGNNENNWARTVDEVMSQLGGQPASGAAPPTPPVAQPRAVASAAPPPSLAQPTFDRQAFGEGILRSIVANRGAVDYGALSALTQQSFTQPQLTTTPTAPEPPATPTPRAGQAGLKGWQPGRPVIGGTRGGEHPTSGLAGYPAYDYFSPAGSPAVAPVTGKVVRLSGHDPKLGAVEGAGGPLGWSVYIKGDDGREYYLTHMGSRNVKVGESVRAGQQIGTVADYDKFGRASHIHMGVSG